MLRAIMLNDVMLSVVALIRQPCMRITITSCHSSLIFSNLETGVTLKYTVEGAPCRALLYGKAPRIAHKYSTMVQVTDMIGTYTLAYYDT